MVTTAAAGPFDICVSPSSRSCALGAGAWHPMPSIAQAIMSDARV